MNIIWNLTRLCPYKCKLCSVCSIPIKSERADSVSVQLQTNGKELNHTQKMGILQELSKTFKTINIDFSGGDPLILKGHQSLIQTAADLKMVTEVTATGNFLTPNLLESFRDTVDTVEFTLDFLPHKTESTREQEYHQKNVEGMKLCAKHGVRVRVCTVLKKDNLGREDLKNLYALLSCLKVAEWELLRFYPIGRGTGLQDLIPSREEYKKAIEYCLSLETKDGPKVGVQHSFSSILQELGLKSNPCQAVINQLGILPDGTVLACPWALNEKGEPLHEIFVLGKVPEDKIETIIKSEKAKEWIKRAITKPPCRTLAFIENHTNGTTAQEAADSEDSYGKRNKVYCSSTTN